MSRPRLIALLLALATLVAYLPVMHHEFLLYDDDDYVTANRIVQNGLTVAGLKWAFTTFHAGNWHPLTWLSHMADCQLFKLNPGAHHLVNVLFHATNSALLFVLLWRLTAKLWPAALVAALFAWHPLHVESVAWVAERKDVLSTFFALLTLLCYGRFAKEGCRRSYWFALLFFALGLMAKPMLVTLPFVLLLLDLWPLNRFTLSTFRLPLLLEKWPFFVLTVASCLITCFAQQVAIQTLDRVPLVLRLENSVVAVARYLLAVFWPTHLSIIYPLVNISGAVVGLAVAALILISAAAWQMRNRNPVWLVGWLWFVGTLIPVIGLVQVGGSAMADRYTYIPSIGIFIAVAFGLYDLAGKLPQRVKIFQTGAVLLPVICLALTEGQMRYWRDSETLFRHAIAVTKDNDLAHQNLGRALDEQGRFAEALAEHREALRVNPRRLEFHFSIGNTLEKMDRLAEALDEYHQCLLVNPNSAALHNAIGRTLGAQGKVAEAMTELALAAQLDPRFATPHLEAAKILFGQGRDAEAVKELNAALAAEPHSVPILTAAARYLAANENAAARDGHTALLLALKANDWSDSNDPETLDVLGMAFAETGDFTNAVACAQSALDLGDNHDAKSTEAVRQRLAGYQNHQPWHESFGSPGLPPKN